MKIKELTERAALAWKILRGSDCNLVAHAQREFDIRGDTTGEPMGRMMAAGVIDLLRVLSTQGHSGFSVHFARGLFDTLSAYKPIGPLTGADAEWFEHGETMGPGTRWQNKRAGHVFKNSDGVAYDIDAVVFEEPGGCRFTGQHSRMPVTFPYTPKSVTAHVAENSSDDEKRLAAALAWRAA